MRRVKHACIPGNGKCYDSIAAAEAGARACMRMREVKYEVKYTAAGRPRGHELCAHAHLGCA